ncbi:unnamed protein product [Colias eurytheme]|nr:unnamed protein product [Colias eurytheme]
MQCLKLTLRVHGGRCDDERQAQQRAHAAATDRSWRLPAGLPRLLRLKNYIISTHARSMRVDAAAKRRGHRSTAAASGERRQVQM